MTKRPRSAVPQLRFLGASGTVTGSRFLVETDSARVLVDCGLFQGLKALRLRNWSPFPVSPDSIDAVLLSHAHVDHSGYLPALVRDGFQGEIFATSGTYELCGIVLPDAAHVQEEDAAYANRKGFSKHSPARPLYTEQDARNALARFRGVDFGSPIEVVPGLRATFRPAGHILGSATITLEIDSPRLRTILFSGDLGRPTHPILCAPAPAADADVIVTESTYGDRRHEDVESLDRFAQAIVRTAERKGMVVIPSFAVDRTEVILYHLRQLMQSGRVPRLPVYVDSPMALAALQVYRRAVQGQSVEIRPELCGSDDPFNPGHLLEARTVEESKGIASQQPPAIVISASGMASGGRVLHHLKNYLPDERNTVILVGFQADGTRGRVLLDGARSIKMLGRYVGVRADVVNVPAFSVHADASELIAWLGRVSSPPDAVFVVHGEPPAAEALRGAIEKQLGWTAAVPRYLEQVRLD